MFGFRLGSIPVRVHFFFFLTAVMLAGGRPGPLLVSWIVVVFVSVLIHELGHALAGRYFGLTPEIELHGMGGTTSWSAGRRLPPWPHIFISVAGPLAGIVVGLAVRYFADRAALSPTASAVAGQLVWVNLGWGVLNLVPMLPLDGGNIMARLLDLVTKGRGTKPAHAISAAIAAVLLVWLLARGGLVGILRGNFGAAWGPILATLFLVQNVRALFPPREPPPAT